MNDVKINENQTNTSNVGRNFVSALKLSVEWGVLTAIIIGCLAAGIWTLVPTALLPWGSGEINLLGYISHCPFAPISSLTLIIVSLIGVGLSTRIEERNPIGYMMLSLGALGILVGALLNGVDTGMFIIGGVTIGIGVLLGIILLLRRE
jgi:hypothetical protein